MEKQEFINRCRRIADDWPMLETRIKRLIDAGVLNLDDVRNGSYTDCYPVVAAILQKTVNECINGSSFESVRRDQKRKMNKYLGAL